MESAGEVADMVISSTPAGPVTDSATGSVSPLPAGPTIAVTPSSSMRRRASSTACWGDVAESPWTSSIGWLWTPPAALISFTASSAAWRKGSPKSERSPVNGNRIAMRSGPASSWARALGPRRVVSRGTIRISAATTPRFTVMDIPRPAGDCRRKLLIDIATSSLMTRITDTRHSVNCGQNRPPPLLTHNAVDTPQHKSRRTSLVYAKCVIERDGTTPGLRCARATVGELDRQSQEQNMDDGQIRDQSGGFARRALLVTE